MNFLHLQCGTITTLISPGDCTLQCGMWLWNRDSEFTKWQHPAMWYVALGWHATEFARWQHPAMWHVALESWHWIRHVAAPCSVAGGSRMTCHWIRPNVRHIGILHLVSISWNSIDNKLSAVIQIIRYEPKLQNHGHRQGQYVALVNLLAFVGRQILLVGDRHSE